MYHPSLLLWLSFKHHLYTTSPDCQKFFRNIIMIAQLIAIFLLFLHLALEIFCSRVYFCSLLSCPFYVDFTVSCLHCPLHFGALESLFPLARPGGPGCI